MKKGLFFSIIAILGLSSCINNPFNENDFINATENEDNGIVLMERGKTILAYNPDTWQLGFNNTQKEFRVSDDMMGYYYTLKCDTMPSEEGQTVEGTLTWTTYNDSVSRHLTFKVAKIGTDGKIWLWNAKYQIGAVVVTLN